MKAQWPIKWDGKTWTGGGAGGWTLTEVELGAMLRAAEPSLSFSDRHDAMAKAIGVPSLANRKADRALQLLRKAGLLEYRAGQTQRGWARLPCDEGTVPFPDLSL